MDKEYRKSNDVFIRIIPFCAKNIITKTLTFTTTKNTARK